MIDIATKKGYMLKLWMNRIVGIIALICFPFIQLDYCATFKKPFFSWETTKNNFNAWKTVFWDEK